MSALAAAVVGTAAAVVVGTAAATAVAMAAATVAVPVLAAALELVVLEAAVPVAAALELVVPEAAALELVVLELAVLVPEAAVPELVVLEAVVRAPVPEVAVLEEAAVLLVERVGEAPVRPELVVVLQAVAEVEQPAEAVRAEVARLRPARAMARRVPVSARLGALARRVRLVPLPALPAWALPQAVAHPTGRRRMGRPRGPTAHRQARGGGHGVTSWRPLLSRRSPAPTSCVPCISGATSLRAPQTA